MKTRLMIFACTLVSSFCYASSSFYTESILKEEYNYFTNSTSGQFNLSQTDSFEFFTEIGSETSRDITQGDISPFSYFYTGPGVRTRVLPYVNWSNQARYVYYVGDQVRPYLSKWDVRSVISSSKLFFSGDNINEEAGFFIEPYGDITYTSSAGDWFLSIIPRFGARAISKKHYAVDFLNEPSLSLDQQQIYHYNNRLDYRLGPRIEARYNSFVARLFAAYEYGWYLRENTDNPSKDSYQGYRGLLSAGGYF